MKLSSSSGALHRAHLPHQGCSAEATTVQSRKKPRPPTRTLRKSQSHRPARPRGGWVTGLDPADGLIGRSTPSQPLVGSGVLGNKLNRRLASKLSAPGARLLSDVEVFSLFMTAFRHRFCVNSFFRSIIDILWSPPMRPSYDRRIAATLPLHDLQNHANVCYPHGTFVSHLYTEVSVLLLV